MTLETLKGKIVENEIPDRWYSIDEGLKSDALILYKNYYKWEFFYLDEKGGRNAFRIFHNEEEAYDYLWEHLKRQSDLFHR